MDREVANIRSLERDDTLLARSFFFDAQWYLARNRDVAATGLDPVQHYLRFGAAEGRDPSPYFQSKIYLAQRPDIAAAGLNPLVHFLRHGITEISDDFERFGINLTDAGPEADLKSVRVKGGPKAVFVTHDLNIGGAPKVLASIAAWFQRSTDYDVYIVAMRDGPLRVQYEQIAPTHVVGYLEVPDELAPSLQEAVRAFVGAEPAFTFVNSVVAGEYCKIDPFDGPVFGFVHEMPKIMEMFDRQFQSFMGGVDHVFCGGTAVHAALTAMDRLAPSQMTVRSAFIDFPAEDRFLSMQDKAARRTALGWPAATKTVVGCGVAHWRKAPDVFVRMAGKLVNDLNCDARFVWIGDGEDMPKLKALAAELEVEDQVFFLGHRDDVRAIFAASDVFALTSMEDPFPLVCLDAAVASAPSVVFREATGMTLMIEPEGEDKAGVAVPLGDEEAYFDAVHRLLVDDRLRESLGRTARDRVLRRYTAESACAELLTTIREVAKLAPRVSVVVPNYNCEPYLEQRLSSIAAQSFKDVEILLLDDRSTDQSRAMLLDFAADKPAVRVILADRNSGGVFKAWNRGIQAATGDLVWIAEADDWCEPLFLEYMVSAFAIPGVRLAHGRSIPVNTRGEVAGDWNDFYLDRIAPGRWRRSFVESAAMDVKAGLGRANTIPNVSGTVVLRSGALRAIEVAKSFRLAGDWAFYLTAAAGGRIAYRHEAINYHRRHERSVTHAVEGTPVYYQELADVGALIHRLYGADRDRDAGFAKFIDQESRRFHFDGTMPEGRLPAGIHGSRRPGILYCVGDLSGGGAQMFAIRFVNKWAETGGSAVLLVVGHEPEHAATRARLAPGIPIVTPEDIKAKGLGAFMRDWGLDLLVSGHWWGDRFVGEWKDSEAVPQPWTVIMHGCYENVLNAPESFPTRRLDFSRAERHVDQWIWTAEKNKNLFEDGYIRPRRTAHIANGFDPVPTSGLTRAQLGLPDDALVFTLASRAIEEKGWRVSLDAFRILRARFAGRRDIRLQLIGDGPMAAELRSQAPIEGLHLVHHTSRLADFINVSNVCLLPSWFAGESLPLVLIEFLAQGKPAIVSDIGMCPWAVRAGANGDGEAAGFVLARQQGVVTTSDLVAAMEHFASQPDLAATLEATARSAFEKFDMNRMIEGYATVFDALLDGPRDRRPDFLSAA